MKFLRHAVGGLLIFALLIILCINIYTGYLDNYSLTKNATKTIDGEKGNIMDHLNNIAIIEGISEIEAGLSGIKPGTASLTDILGGIASAAIGVLKTIAGLFVLPYSIGNVIGTFYLGEGIPGFISGFALLITVYVGFIVLSAYLKHDI